MVTRDEANRAEQHRGEDPARWQNQVITIVEVARVLADCSRGLREEAARLREEAARLREEARRLREDAARLRR